jgi:hypothetical protein
MNQLFLDCDGVLADFDTAAREFLGMCPREHEHEHQHGSAVFWEALEDHGSFYRDLPLMPDARELFDAVKHLNPIILTGCPKGDWAQPQKTVWAHQHFPGTAMIMCRSAEKSKFMRPGDVIIDDWPEYRGIWQAKGGIWIDHKSAEQSLDMLWHHKPEWRK